MSTMDKVKCMLRKSGYKAEKETELGLIATKDSERFLIANFQISKNEDVIQEAEILKELCHPHIMGIQESLKDEHLNLYSVVLQFCEGGSLADKIKEKKRDEEEALSWIVEVCMALRAIHEKSLVHGDLTPQNIFLTEFGKLCLGGFWQNRDSFRNTAAGTARNEAVHYQPPEVLNTTYNTKREVWSLGCILYEMCTQQQAFSADNRVDLISKITHGSAPGLDGTYSEGFRELLSDMLNNNPDYRPTANKILGRPITLTCLLTKSETTVKYLQDQLDKLKQVANDLERIHENTTIGSLAGGVIGAAGGITSIVGLVLAPFTLGASLIVTGVGVGVGVAGGITAGVSNITKMVSQSADRKVVRGILKEFSEKVNAVAFWLQEINHSLENKTKGVPKQMPSDGSSYDDIAGNASAARIGKVLGGAAEVTRLATVAKLGTIAGQVSRVVRVTEVATGVLSALFVAVDIFFIAMDAKEISNIRQAQADGETSSEIMKFVLAIRNSTKELQEVLDELKVTIRQIGRVKDFERFKAECTDKLA